MRIKRLYLKNIRSYSEQEIIFPDGSVLLSGGVGAGKTTVLLALEYALFGLQPGQKASALLRNTSNEAAVTLELEIEGKEIIIERSLKRESKGISSDYASLTLDGEKIEYSVTELKTKILELLDYPFELIKKNNLLYRYTVYTPQENMKNIITEDPESRLNVLRYVFGIDRFKRITENLVVLTTNLKDQAKILTGEIKSIIKDKENLEDIKTILESRKKLITDLAQKLINHTLDRQQKEAALQELEVNLKKKIQFEKEVEKTKILYGSKKEQIQSINREQKDLELALANQSKFEEKEYLDVLSSLTALKEEIDKKQKELIIISGNLNSLRQSEEETSSKKERIFKIEMCPTCLQDVTEVHKHNILNETEKTIKDISRKSILLISEKDKISNNLIKLKEKLIILENKRLELDILKSKTAFFERARIKLQELEKNKSYLESDLILLEKHITGLKEEISIFSKFDSLFKTRQLDLIKSIEAERAVDRELAAYTKEIELRDEEQKRILEELSQKQEKEKKLHRITELSDWLSTQFIGLVNIIEVNVMLTLRNEFSKLFSKWFSMIGGESFEVRLDENFTPIIMQGGIEMEYSFLSGGERTAVALAYRLALNQTINSVLSTIKTRDIVILDEPTDGFSEIQIDKMRDILEELNVNQLIIVSHEQKIDSFVDYVIKLKKEGDISTLIPIEKESHIESNELTLEAEHQKP